MQVAEVVGADSSVAYDLAWFRERGLDNDGRFVLKNRESRKSEYWQEKYDALVNDPDEFSNLGKLCAGHGNFVYAYFPTKSELDAEALKDAHAVPCIRLFLHDSKVHGFSFSRAVAERLINLSHEELTGLYSAGEEGRTLVNMS